MEQTKIEKLYDNPSSKGFINHLIQSYLPTDKVVKVWEFEKTQKHSCNVCGQALMDIEEAYSNFHENQDDLMKDVMKNIRNAFDPSSNVVENPIVKHIGKGKLFAFTGKNTTTCLCMSCVQELLDMTQNLLLRGDNNISYQINKMRRTQIFDTFKESPKLNNDEKQKVKEIEKVVDKKKATFADMDILQQLKEKMEKEFK